MSRFRLVMAIVFPILLGILGFFLGDFFSLPKSYYSHDQSRIFYALVGVLIGLLTFAKLASWLIRTFTNLIKSLTAKIAGEVIEQFAQIRTTKRRLPFISNLHLLTPQTLKSDNISQIFELSNSKKKTSSLLILDTSSIIDGRILDVARTGFLVGVILLPNFVLIELQKVADSSDDIKRARGRKGFETLDQLKKIEGLRVVIWDKEVKGKDVDEKLVNLGKMSKGKILTCDYNLNRVAKLSGVSVLNLNELANSLKMVVLPGESFEIKVIQKGKDDNQGVGYLEDGTMVVIEKGSSLLGKTISIEATKMIQNPAGKIIFGRMVSLPKSN